MRRNVRGGIPKEELRAELRELEKRSLLWSNVEFQEQFVKPLEKDLERLSNSQWILNNEELTTLLRELGFPVAQTGESLLTLFLCTRSVVGFMEKRLRPFRQAEGKLDELKKELERSG